MAMHCCNGNPCTICHPLPTYTLAGAPIRFDDLGKLELALAQRDALVKALEEIEDLGANGVTAARLGNIAHAALISIRIPVGTPPGGSK